MKHIYIEVSEDDYSNAKEIGFFEIADELRTHLKEIIRAHKEHNYGNSKIHQI